MNRTALITALIATGFSCSAMADGFTNSGAIKARVAHEQVTAGAHHKGFQWDTQVVNTRSARQDASNSQWQAVSKSEVPADDDAETSVHGATGFYWGVLNDHEQAGFYWGVLNDHEQTGFYWGVLNDHEQTGFYWGVLNDHEQAGFQWDSLNTHEHTGFYWGVLGAHEQTGFYWGVL